MRVDPTEKFSTTLHVSFADASAFAALAGDRNPLHHDPDFAAGTRYKVPIISGPQMAAQLMGFLASHYAARGAVIGHDISFRFHVPIPADQEITLEWSVDSVTEAPHLKSDVVILRGRILTAAGKVATTAKARILVGGSF
ncbi:MAG: MaoC family dehydratase [Rhodoplanes sp.]|uniref:MaoC family dehydratase n=1 Tax=Rhodoplanes sp. TaxID=1968906 RepID=UPI00181F631F|nr:MaoC family dehydratase [Rhodoplanes sp.]NVO13350.1 MaoC family dehydratase [Rhodoplanes sp.]